MDFSEKIKELRKRRGLTLEEVGQVVGVGKSTVRKWENGDIKNMRRDKIALLAQALGVSPSTLMGWEENEALSSALRIPVLGSIPAGIPMEAIEDILDWEEAPASWANGGSEYFALRLSGDSMYPEYRKGDVVIFRRQDTCESGEDCAVMVNGCDATFKRVKLSDKGVALLPINPAYDPMFYTNSQVRSLPVQILGVFWELRRKHK